MRDGTEDRVTWVPVCPSCGARMRNPKLIAGDAPPEAPRSKRLRSMGWPCQACGELVGVEDVEAWARVEESVEADDTDALLGA